MASIGPAFNSSKVQLERYAVDAMPGVLYALSIPVRYN